jgi:glutathione S-transferase
MPKLVIGNKNYSSWSLRAWLYLRESQVDFEEIHIKLFSASDWRGELARYTPASRVPVLVYDDLTVWDSAAIIETVREREPGAIDWPDNPAARAEARAVSAEMHSGFLAIRDELPQNLRAETQLVESQLSPVCRDEIERVENIWKRAQERYGTGGPWLFGAFSIADIMYAPVALRFLTYNIALRPESIAFVENVHALESVQEFIAEAKDEPEVLDFIDDLVPTHDAPLTPG